MSSPDDTTATLDRVKLVASGDSRVSATLVVLAGKLPLGKMFRVIEGATIIGRSTDADVWVDDEGVSRQHAKLVYEGEVVSLVDMGSTNGTFVNGARVDTARLNDGDKIQIGSSTILRFNLQDKLDEEMQKNLFESATHDGLTGVPNRRLFLETLEKEFAYCARHQVSLTLIMFDLDRFKQVNDTRGHPAGDYVLTRVAQKVVESIRVEDIFARYGGEEFVLLVRECRLDRGGQIADRIRKSIEKLDLQFNHQSFHITVSAGVATYENNNLGTAPDLVKEADDALYRAKSGGRNRVELA